MENALHLFNDISSDSLLGDFKFDVEKEVADFQELARKLSLYVESAPDTEVAALPTITSSVSAMFSSLGPRFTGSQRGAEERALSPLSLEGTDGSRSDATMDGAPSPASTPQLDLELFGPLPDASDAQENATPEPVVDASAASLCPPPLGPSQGISASELSALSRART